MSIKFLAEDDRPREKFLLKGKSALSDSELLAIILGSGNNEDAAVELARKILASVDYNWQKLSKLSIKDLMKFKGIGEAKAISVAVSYTHLDVYKRQHYAKDHTRAPGSPLGTFPPALFGKGLYPHGTKGRSHCGRLLRGEYLQLLQVKTPLVFGGY